MKIAINGSIVDTKNIYKIKKIKGDNCWGDKSKKADKDLYHCRYYFNIKMFNKKHIYIELDPKKYFGDLWWSVYTTDYDEYLNRLKFTKSKLNTFRDSIVKIWSKNQSEIPQFNLK